MKFKDANECLMAGVVALLMQGCLDNARDFAPKQVVPAAAYAEEFMQEWFGSELEPGFALPFKFPFKIRMAELTVWTGIEKSGKTTLLGHVLVELMAQGQRALIASFEVRPRRTLKKLSRQVYGGLIFNSADIDPTASEVEKERLYQAAQAQARKTFEWLARNLWLYDHTGIGKWRVLMDDIRWAVRRYGIRQVVIDNFMRLGIPKDDYAQQADAITQLTGLAMELDIHIHVVVHQNKTAEGGKRTVSGAYEIIANAHNIVEVQRNEKKGQAVSEAWDKCKAGIIDEKARNEKLAELDRVPDGKFILHAQRDGEQQNASRYLWFLWKSQQYCEHPPHQPEHRATVYCDLVGETVTPDLPTTEPDLTTDNTDGNG